MSNFSEINDDLKFIYNQNLKIWNRLKNKSIFLTGGSGPFGFWILKSFIYVNKKHSLNSKIFVLTRNKKNKIFNFCKDKSVTIVQGDIRSFKFKGKKIDYIIHGATTTAKETYNKQDPNEKFSVLYDGTKRILDFARKNKCKNFLFLSSGAVYGNRDKNIKFNEKMEIAPITNDLNFDVSVLGEAKRSAEILSIIFSIKSNCKVNIARCFSFIGPFMPLNIHYAAGNFLRDAITKKLITIKGNPKTVRSYLYFSDLVIILWKIILSNKNRQIYNIGSDKPVNLLNLAKNIKKIIPKINLKIKNKYKKNISYYVPSIKKIKKEFKFIPKNNLYISLFKTYKSILNNKKFYKI